MNIAQESSKKFLVGKGNIKGQNKRRGRAHGQRARGKKKAKVGSKERRRLPKRRGGKGWQSSHELPPFTLPATLPITQDSPHFPAQKKVGNTQRGRPPKRGGGKGWQSTHEQPSFTLPATLPVTQNSPQNKNKGRGRLPKRDWIKKGGNGKRGKKGGERQRTTITVQYGINRETLLERYDRMEADITESFNEFKVDVMGTNPSKPGFCLILLSQEFKDDLNTLFQKGVTKAREGVIIKDRVANDGGKVCQEIGKRKTVSTKEEVEKWVLHVFLSSSTNLKILVVWKTM